jgi:ElaA protein
MKFTTSCKSFHQLTPKELYDILRLRSEVFVVEQKCIFLDMDNKDQYCDHVMIYADRLAATSRLVPPGVSYAEMSVGRIVSHPSMRGLGAGKLLMEASLRLLFERFGKGPVKIGAQYYLKKFYESYGFVQCSGIYDEDGIDHILMIRAAT